MAKTLTLERAKQIAEEYITSNKIGEAGYTATADTLTGILLKIGLMTNIVSPVQDTMPETEGEYLPLGKIVEEWFEDLTQPEDFDETGADALAPSYSKYRPTVYSYDLGRKKFKKTIPNDKYEPLSLSQADLIKLINSILERLYSSKTLYRNYLKMELIHQFIAKGIELYDQYNYEHFNVGDTLKSGEYVITGPDNERRLFVAVATTTAMTSTNVTSDDNFKSYLENETRKSNVVEIKIKERLNKPSATNDEVTKNFLISLDTIMVKTKRASEGNSLSGNTLGVQNPADLTLYVADDILPIINAYKSTIPSSSLINFETQVKPLGEFVEYYDEYAGLDTYAVLVDTRGVKLHNNYTAMRTQPNGEGDFNNYILHDGNTAHISPNTFIHIWEE